MNRRPSDILTPREREVLDLIRRGLTNEEIAHRLDISLDGAKYHVSQILSKLGVATREEAAALPLGERRRWWAAWPLWAKIAGAGTVVAVIVGLTVLAWGVWQTQGGESETSASTGSSLIVTSTVPSVPTIDAGHYSNGTFRVEFDYPPSWTVDPGYSLGSSYKDPRGRQFGFFVVNACCTSDQTVDDVAKLSAEHLLRPFGDQPRIETLSLPEGEARLIMPDETRPDINDGELIVRYTPVPLSISDSYAFFILDAHKDFIRDIASTLKLTGSPLPTP